jgi:hypothetical protein
MAPTTLNSEGGSISPDFIHPFVKAIEMTRRAIYYSKDNQQQVSWNELARRVRDGFDPGLEVYDFNKTYKYKTKCQEGLENQKWIWDTEGTGRIQVSPSHHKLIDIMTNDKKVIFPNMCATRKR